MTLPGGPFLGRRCEREHLTLLALAAVILLAFVLRSLPYLVGDPRFEVGFDTGFYEWYLSSFLGEEWSGLPAYPPGLDHPSGRLFEPGLFVTLSTAAQFEGGDLGEAFRFHLPLLVSMLIGLVSFIVSRRLTDSDAGGLLGAFFFSVSYMQVVMVTESYYKQTIATFLLISSLYYLDLYLKEGERRRLLPFIVLFAGTSFYHLPMTFIGLLGIVAVLACAGWRREVGRVKDIALSLLTSGTVALPGWFPRMDIVQGLIRSTVSKSAWRSSTLISGEGVWEQGGAIPEILWGYDHVLVGYILVFIPLVVLATVSYHGLKVRGSLMRSIPLLSVVIWAYAGLWLFFGNRFVYTLDLILCLIAPVATLFLVRLPRRAWVKVAVLAIAALAFTPPVADLVEHQTEISPYITENLQGVDWLLDNIDGDAVVFAPDYLSANLIQEGWTMAIWDPYISSEGNPLGVAEEFMLEAPTNGTFLLSFLDEHPLYRDRELVVLWGEWDLDRPLVSSGEMIPIEAYGGSEWFDEVYRGEDEIHRVYSLSPSSIPF